MSVIIAHPPNEKDILLIYKNVIDDIIIKYTRGDTRLFFNSGEIGKEISDSFNLKDYTSLLYVKFILDVYHGNVSFNKCPDIGWVNSCPVVHYFYLYVNYVEEEIVNNTVVSLLAVGDYRFKTLMILKYICETSDTKHAKRLREEIMTKFEYGLSRMESGCRKRVLEVSSDNFKTWQEMRYYMDNTTFETDESDEFNESDDGPRFPVIW